MTITANFGATELELGKPSFGDLILFGLGAAIAFGGLEGLVSRGFRVPLVPLFPIISVVLCGGLMTGLTVITWIRFFVWLALGLVIYFTYSRRHSEFAGGTQHLSPDETR